MSHSDSDYIIHNYKEQIILLNNNVIAFNNLRKRQIYILAFIWINILYMFINTYYTDIHSLYYDTNGFRNRQLIILLIIWINIIYLYMYK
jgi:hypothetical protein